MTHWIDEAARDAALAYLRTCEVGGMPSKLAGEVRKAVEGMAHSGYFSVAVSSAIVARGCRIVTDEEAEDRVADETGRMIEDKAFLMAENERLRAALRDVLYDGHGYESELAARDSAGKLLNTAPTGKGEDGE